METRSTRLANGMTVWGVHVPGRTVTSLVSFPSGARHEREEENGIAHFLEHMVFKGGERWTDYRAVNQAADELGASMNAFTSHDSVGFHIKSRAEDAHDALDLLTDFVGRSHLDADELEKERGVIVQEIAMYADRPSSVADELLDRACYGDHPLGRSILGPVEHIESLPREAFVRFRARTWSTRVGGIVIAGDLHRAPEFARLAELGERFSSVDADEEYEAAPSVGTDVLVEARESEQSHLRHYYPLSLDYRDYDERAALSLVGTALGGSMSSMLFDEIREQRGLCYAIGSYALTRSDDAGIAVSAGLDSDKCLEAHRLIGDIVGDLPQRLDAETIDRARRCSIGKRAMSLEATTTVARIVASQSLDGETPDVERMMRAIQSVTDEAVREMAARLERSVVAVVGPHERGEFE